MTRNETGVTMPSLGVGRREPSSRTELRRPKEEGQLSVRFERRMEARTR